MKRRNEHKRESRRICNHNIKTNFFWRASFFYIRTESFINIHTLIALLFNVFFNILVVKFFYRFYNCTDLWFQSKQKTCPGPIHHTNVKLFYSGQKFKQRLSALLLYCYTDKQLQNFGTTNFRHVPDSLLLFLSSDSKTSFPEWLVRRWLANVSSVDNAEFGSRRLSTCVAARWAVLTLRSFFGCGAAKIASMEKEFILAATKLARWLATCLVWLSTRKTGRSIFSIVKWRSLEVFQLVYFVSLRTEKALNFQTKSFLPIAFWS